MIKNIIFDVGRVLIDWNPKITMNELGFCEEESREIYEAIYDSGAWAEEDRGVKSRAEMYEYLASLCPKHADKIRLYYEHATDSAALMPYTHEWINRLRKAGYKIYILSNFGEYAWNRAVEMGAIDFVEMVDGKVVSYEIKHIKPEPEIYKEILTRFCLKSEECVFIDDALINVEGARSVGISAIRFNGYEEACENLARLGVVF